MEKLQRDVTNIFCARDAIPNETSTVDKIRISQKEHQVKPHRMLWAPVIYELGLLGVVHVIFQRWQCNRKRAGGVYLFVSTVADAVMVFGSEVTTHRYSNIDQYFTFDLLTTSQ